MQTDWRFGAKHKIKRTREKTRSNAIYLKINKKLFRPQVFDLLDFLTRSYLYSLMEMNAISNASPHTQTTSIFVGAARFVQIKLHRTTFRATSMFTGVKFLSVHHK